MKMGSNFKVLQSQSGVLGEIDSQEGLLNKTGKVALTCKVQVKSVTEKHTRIAHLSYPPLLGFQVSIVRTAGNLNAAQENTC